MKCFLSHNSKDKPIAEKIGRRLLRHNIDVWFDKWDIYAGESLTSKIEEGIQESSVFVVLLSSNSVKAKWVKEELRIAIQRRLNDPDFKLIPIKLEECDIPGFLKDYLYIDWTNNHGDPFLSLLRAIKQVSEKPEHLSNNVTCSIEYKKILHVLHMKGNRGLNTSVSEFFEAKAASNIKQVDRALHFAGRLQNVNVDGLEIERSLVNPQYEKWILKPQSPIPTGKEFEFKVSYELKNCFDEDKEKWFYSVEAPTDKLIIEFDFANATYIKSLTVYHRQGQTLFPESIQPKLEGSSWRWEKLFPAYKDTYEFHFIWEA